MTKMQQTIADICDVFSGADGAVAYFKFRCLCEDMEKKADAGDEGAKQICDVVYHFQKLIDVASKR